MSKDQRDYTINPSQITHIHEDKNISGTWVILSCGTKIFANASIHEIKEIIDNA
jgi:hypothetical protein